MKKSLRSLWVSLLSLLLCFSMLIGTTYAWFTDSVESGNNLILAGNLDIELYWTKDLEDGSWINAEDDTAEPIFNYDKWEPGYTEVRYIKIVNAGSLAFKYSLSIIPDGEVGILADVIDVYFVENATQNIGGREDLADKTPVGVLKNVINGDVSANGILLPDGKTETGKYSGELVVAIALKMREGAGNEYMKKSVGDSFSIQLVATQYANESDSFDAQYDADAKYSVSNAEELRKALAKGGNITLFDNITADSNMLVVPEGVKARLYLNGFGINGEADIADGEQASQVLLAIKKDAELTVFGDGEITMSTTGTDIGSDYMSCVFLVQGGDLTVNEGVSIDNTDGVLQTGFAVDVDPNYADSSVIDLNGASLSSYDCPIHIRAIGPTDVTVYADACTITSRKSVSRSAESNGYAVWMECDGHQSHADAEHLIFINDCAVTGAIQDDCAADGHDLVIYEDGDIHTEMTGAITVRSNDELAKTLVKKNSGSTVVLAAGEYTIPNLATTVSDFTIIGTAFAKINGMTNKNSAYKNFTFKNITFAGDVKGSFYGDCLIKDCVFDKAGLTPSCYVSDTGTLTIENCTFNDSPSNSLHFATASSRNYGTVIVKGCTFNNGFINNPKTLNFSLEDCDFNNTILCPFGPITISNTTFDETSMIYIAPTAVVDVTVTLNDCSVDGGAGVDSICYYLSEDDYAYNPSYVKQFIIDGATYNFNQVNLYQ